VFLYQQHGSGVLSWRGAEDEIGDGFELLVRGARVDAAPHPLGRGGDAVVHATLKHQASIPPRGHAKGGHQQPSDEHRLQDQTQAEAAGVGGKAHGFADNNASFIPGTAPRMQINSF
jgi:hypothetical protein